MQTVLACSGDIIKYQNLLCDFRLLSDWLACARTVKCVICHQLG